MSIYIVYIHEWKSALSCNASILLAALYCLIEAKVDIQRWREGCTKNDQAVSVQKYLNEMRLLCLFDYVILLESSIWNDVWGSSYLVC